MKLDAVLSYVLSILEGGLAGACFYRAGKMKETKHKVLWYVISAAWFMLSVADGVLGTRELKAAMEPDEAEAELDF